MKRSALLLTAAVLFAALSVAQAAPKKRKRAAQDEKPPATPAPSALSAFKPRATPAPVQKPPADAPLPSPWRTWGDASGRTLEAAFAGLAGNVLTVQTREAKTYRLNLLSLLPQDQAFARDYARRLQARAFADSYVKQAAYTIDHLVGSTLVSKGLKFNPPATDEQFIRRIYLDIAGRVPTAEEARTFLADTVPDKRAKIIDTLLYSPSYTMNLYNWMADALRVRDDIDRRAYTYLFQDWLKDQLAADRPWDALVRDMLTADGKLCENGPAGFLLRDAMMPLDGVSNLLTTFLGANVACAQCHDHPLADWSQKDFYQMAAFFGASDGYDNDLYRQAQRIGNSMSGGASKGQTRIIAMNNALRLVDTNKNTLKIPDDYKYSDAKPGSPVKPELIEWKSGDKNSPAYKISTGNPQQLRDEFAKWMTHPENPRFAANIANRLWKKTFGLAVQEPVSDLDDPKKASNPALLAHISAIMKSARFDLRQFQRVLYNSQTYQRAASLTPDLEKGPYLFPGPLLRRMTSEQAWDSLVTMAVGTDADALILRRGEDMQLFSLPGTVTVESIKTVANKLQEAGVGMGYGGGGKKRGGGKASLDAYEGGTPQQRNGLVLARASELPQPAPETHFLRLFGQSDRLVADSNTTDGSVPQALMLMNGSAARLVTDANSAVLTAATGEPDQKIESLYLAFFSRKPTAGESAAAKKALDGGLAAADLAWTMLNAREFLFVQ